MTVASGSAVCWSQVMAWDGLIEIVTDPPVAADCVWMQITFPDLSDPVLVILDSDEARNLSAGLALAALSADQSETS